MSQYKRYYTPHEATYLVPVLETAFTSIVQIRRCMREVYAVLEDDGYAPDSDTVDLSEYAEAPLDVLQRLARFKALLDTLRDELVAIADLGLVVKDLDLGLVDFYGRFQDKEVMLCWQLGEKEVLYWHEIQGSYHGRRHVSELSVGLLPPKDNDAVAESES